MFRISALLVCFFALVLVVLAEYQRVTQLNIISCSEFSGCYAQLIERLSLVTISTQNIAILLHDISTLGLLLFLGVMLMISFLLKTTSLKIIVSTIILTVLVVVQTQLNLHPAYLPNQAVIHYLLSAGILLVGFTLFLHSQLGYVKKANASRQCLLVVGIILLLLQGALGVWLATNNVALVCDDFLQCLNSWWLQADYKKVFNLFTPLTQHILLAIVVLLMLTWLMLTATKNQLKQIRWAGIAIGLLLLLQFATGIGIVKMATPVWLVIIHALNALVLMLPLIVISFYSRYTRSNQQALPIQLIADQDHIIAESALEAVIPEIEPESLYLRLKSQLGKTRTGLGAALSILTSADRKIDRDLLEEIETSLLMADVGMDVTTDIITRLEESVEHHQLHDVGALSALLKQQLLELLKTVSQPLVIADKPDTYIILVVGVNGVGKTTTIGKLAQRLQQQGHSVMLAAGDTFRAAAVEQLQVWAERNNIHLVAQHTGADSASVIFDAVQSARAKNIDVLIADTAGRLHTQSNLMQELKKIKRIISKVDDTAPHEVLLVLDAGTGQNALIQAEHFNQSLGLTGIALTKLDGTAKGGMIFALAKKIGVPIRFLGVGEGIHDLQNFNAEQFINALFDKDTY